VCKHPVEVRIKNSFSEKNRVHPRRQGDMEEMRMKIHPCIYHYPGA
jgi:hypothetical protein